MKEITQIVGYCNYEGECSDCRCDGKGNIRKWVDQDPCGKSIYENERCPYFTEVKQ